MKKILFVFFLLIGIFSISCEKLETNESLDVHMQKAFVYKERDPHSPLILSMPHRSLIRKARIGELNFENILGRSFKTDCYPFENMENIGEPVLDMDKLELDHSDWLSKVALKQSSSVSYSYSTFDRYEENSTSFKKVNSGFELKLGIFKLGNKNIYYQKFTTSLLENSKSVFGQLDIEIKDAMYNLAVNSSRLNQIKENYVKEDFINDIYNLAPYELFTFYGPFVLTNFITGGRTTALFAGITKDQTVGSVREQNMEHEISTAFTFKGGNSNISLGLGKGFTNASSSMHAFTQLESAIITMGGLYGFGTFTPPQSIDDMNFDLSAWANSLNKADTHTLIEINNGGLLPISSLLTEQNLKKQYENYVAGNDLPAKKYVEPRLVCVRIPISGIYQYLIYLITRFNDAIEIRRERFLWNDRDSEREFSAIFDNLSNIYKIKAEYNTWQSKDANSVIAISDYTVPDESFKGMGSIFFEIKMKKYYDEENRMLYLLYCNDSKKIGYSINMRDGDYLLDTYGIREWVNSLSVTSVQKRELMDYYLIAL